MKSPDFFCMYETLKFLVSQIFSVEEAEGLRGLLFGQRDRPGIEDADTAFKHPVFGDMGVAVNEGGSGGDCGQVFRVPQVTVGQEEAVFINGKLGVIRHNRKLEQHLIDFGIAIAAHRQNLFTAGIEQFGYFCGIVEAGDAVARAVVQYIPQQNQLVCLQAVSVRQQFFNR